MPEIARLDPVNLRDVWRNEANDFTPWLAKNLDRLGEALGMDLEHVETEAPVGSFSLDIQARDANGNRKVVIENQLEPTNHDHLGKVLTYAAGLDADVMVWVVREFRDEHRQALDWLNQRTSEETEFWGVEVKAVRIGNSAPASVFEVVSRPNNYRKSRILGSEGGQQSLYKQAYFAFWPRVLDRLRDVHKLTSRRRSTTDSWIDFSSGIPGVKRNVSFSRQDTDSFNRRDARIDLFLDKGDLELTKRLFDLLHIHRGRLEDAMGEEFNWERLDNRRASRIALYLPNRSVRDPEGVLNDTADWMVNKYVKLVESVIPILRELAEEFDACIASMPDGEDSPDDPEAEAPA